MPQEKKLSIPMFSSILKDYINYWCVIIIKRICVLSHIEIKLFILLNIVSFWDFK